MDPCRRRQGQFQPQRQTDNDGADHKDAKDGRTVAGVVPAEPEAAGFTAVRYIQKSVKQSSLAAAGAAAAHPQPDKPRRRAGGAFVGKRGPGVYHW